jgi:RNA polymerase sigma-70 factor, ECF subfamily
MKKWNSLEDLYKLYYTEIFYYLFQRVRNKELAQDLAQDTFLKAFNGLETFEGKSSIKTWLYSIAHHTFINWYRKETKYHFHSIEEAVPLEQTVYLDPEFSLQKKQKTQLLLQMISELKEEFQHVLILREFQDLTYDEIAEILDWKLSKVKTNLHRAKLELRKRLVKKEDGSYEMFFD